MRARMLAAMTVAAAAGAIALGGAPSASAITIYPSEAACNAGALQLGYADWSCLYKNGLDGWIIQDAQVY